MNHGRQVGVRVPENQSTEQAPVMTVTNYTAAQFALVEYGDERGIKHTTLALIVGGKAFVPPQGEAWTAGFRPFSAAINDQIMDRHAAAATRAQSQAPVVPASDAVDVLGSGDDEKAAD